MEKHRLISALAAIRRRAIVLALVGLIWTFTAIAMIGQSEPTAGKDSGSSVASLLEQSSKLEAENSRLAAEKNDPLKEETTLQQQDSDLKARAKKLQNEKLEFKMDADALQQDMTQYNAQCGGPTPGAFMRPSAPQVRTMGCENRQAERKPYEQSNGTHRRRCKYRPGPS